MAEDIAGICRECVHENAAKFAAAEEDVAVHELVAIVRQRLDSVAWGAESAEHYGVDIEAQVREQLRRIRTPE